MAASLYKKPEVIVYMASTFFFLVEIEIIFVKSIIVKS